MTFEELISFTRKQLGDTVEPYLFSTDELSTYALNIVNYFIAETYLYPMVEQYPITALTEYITPNYANVLLNVFDVYFGDFLTEISQQEAQNYIGQIGVPKYYRFYNSRLYLYPIPEEGGTLYIKRRNGISSVDLSSSIPIPENYHLFLVDGIMWQAYSKADSEIANVEVAIKHFNQFEMWINRVKKYRLLETQTLTYSPIHGGLL